MKTAENILSTKGNNIFSVPFDLPIKKTIDKMIEWKIGSIIVEKNHQFIGLWTERDLMRNVQMPGFDIKTAKVGDYMLERLYTTSHESSIYELMDKFLGLRVRHLLIENNGVFLGVLSIGDVMKSMINDKTEELKSLDKIINWEYYENWQWK
ncbi:MAG: CBS domain-containing protein [Deltaproteobacteria bacterium]|nr:CBS domain-containing protein [Deltaproteobacteria bacterium]